MPRTGKCPNFTGCLLASRNEIITIPGDAPFTCPECRFPLVESKPLAIPAIILGGISLLVIMGAAAVYYQARHISLGPTGQIGTSFEQAEIAGSQHQFLPSRHMETPPPIVRAYTQFSAGDTLELVRMQMGLDTCPVRYRSSMPEGEMGVVYFLPGGNLHIDAKRVGDTWVILSAPLLEPSTIPAADREAEWDRGADRQNLPAK